jgi:hypothetical protein
MSDMTQRARRPARVPRSAGPSTPPPGTSHRIPKEHTQ